MQKSAKWNFWGVVIPKTISYKFETQKLAHATRRTKDVPHPCHQRKLSLVLERSTGLGLAQLAPQSGKLAGLGGRRCKDGLLDAAPRQHKTHAGRLRSRCGTQPVGRSGAVPRRVAVQRADSIAERKAEWKTAQKLIRASHLIEGYGRHERIRTADLYRVKVAL
jgi:hypothetical protein